MPHNRIMKKPHPLAQFCTGFCAVSILTLIYVATPNRPVPVTHTATQANGTFTGP
jgi:hypothetical protein